MTFRIELPLPIFAFDAFPSAYRAAAWMCWVLNITCVEIYLRRTRAFQRRVVRYLHATR